MKVVKPVLVESGVSLPNNQSVKELVNPDYSGPLMTMVHTGEWKHHWFVLKDGFIYNFADRDDTKPYDVIYMDDAVVELTEEKPNIDASETQSFTITTVGRTCVVCGIFLPIPRKIMKADMWCVS